MRLLLFVLILFLSITTYCQSPELKAALDSGIALHDRGEFEKALVIYDQVIAKDDQYFDAWYEKSLTLYAARRLAECVTLCEQIQRKFPDSDENRKVYANWGSALDDMGNHDEAIKIYNKGIKKYPEAFLLYLNRGITYYLQQHPDEAAEDMKRVIQLNPTRASAHLYLGYSVYPKNRMAAVLSLSTFLMLEREGARAAKNLQVLEKLLSSNVEQKDEKNITISLSAPAKKHKGPDDFSAQEMLISFSAALDYDEKNKNLDAAQKMKKKLEPFCGVTVDKKNPGFFTATYIPLFTRIQEDSLLETACYVMHSSSIVQWLQNNAEKVRAFDQLLSDFPWRRD
jgi:tetratricopeptide (TPR) repeat protein